MTLETRQAYSGTGRSVPPDADEEDEDEEDEEDEDDEPFSGSPLGLVGSHPIAPSWGFHGCRAALLRELTFIAIVFPLAIHVVLQPEG